MKISHHAKVRFLERVMGIEDTEDPRSLELAGKILDDNSCHLDLNVSCVLPIVGFKGAHIQVRDNTVITVLTDDMKKRGKKK